MRSLIALSTGVVLVLELVELFLVACLWVLALVVWGYITLLDLRSILFVLFLLTRLPVGLRLCMFWVGRVVSSSSSSSSSQSSESMLSTRLPCLRPVYVDLWVE